MSYTVDLGCWGSIFAVPTDVVDKYLKIAGSAQLKVLLWILRHSGEQFEIETISEQLNMGTFDVKDCIEFWTSFNIISADNNIITPAGKSSQQAFAQPAQTTLEQKMSTEQMSKPVSVEKTVPPVRNTPVARNITAASNEVQPAAVKPRESERVQKPIERPSDTVVARPLRPDPVYVAKRVSEDKEIAALLNEAQYILGRPISPNENAGMIMMHDNDGLPCEVILMLLTYGASNQKGMRQIEAMGAAWAKEGIKTLEQADEKIRELEESKEAWHKVQSILGLEFRKPTQKEEENYTRWIKEWNFSDDMIKEAYDICVNSKGKYIPNYVNTVLHRWYQNNIKTVEQVRAERSKSQQRNSSSGGGNIGGDSGRKSSFDINDLSGMSMFND